MAFEASTTHEPKAAKQPHHNVGKVRAGTASQKMAFEKASRFCSVKWDSDCEMPVDRPRLYRSVVSVAVTCTAEMGAGQMYGMKGDTPAVTCETPAVTTQPPAVQDLSLIHI